MSEQPGPVNGPSRLTAELVHFPPSHYVRMWVEVQVQEEEKFDKTMDVEEFTEEL